MNGRISRFKLYNTAVEKSKYFETIRGSVFEPPGIPTNSVVQGFTNFKLTKGAKYQYPNKIDKEVCDEGLEDVSCTTKASGQ